MKKLLIIMLILILILPSFSEKGPFKKMCEQFKTLNNSNFSLITDQLVNELNQQILKLNMTTALNEVNNTTFSAEIKYNNSLCFAGSFNFLNGNISYIKLTPDKLAGTNNNHITFKIELSNFDNITTSLINLKFSEIKGGQIKDILNLIWRLITSFFKGDISIKPINGLIKVFKALFIFTKLNFEKITNQSILK